MWDDLARTLVAKGLRVVRMDVRGHGASPVPPRPYALAALAADVAALLDQCGIGQAHWVGLSMGGMIGQAFALDHAGRLGKLVLANTTSSYGADGRKMWEARAKAVEEGGMAAITDLAMTRYFSDEFRERHPDAVDRVRSRFLQADPRGYIACCDAIRELDFTDRLYGIRARTLVIAGEKDAGTPPAMSEEIVRRILAARLAIIPGAAHLSAVEKPREFGALGGGDLFLRARGRS
jgi:3-oxoadipate enol-lactonase